MAHLATKICDSRDCHEEAVEADLWLKGSVIKLQDDVVHGLPLNFVERHDEAELDTVVLGTHPAGKLLGAHAVGDGEVVFLVAARSRANQETIRVR